MGPPDREVVTKHCSTAYTVERYRHTDTCTVLDVQIHTDKINTHGPRMARNVAAEKEVEMD